MNLSNLKITKYLLRSILTSFIVILPILFLATILVTQAYSIVYPWYLHLYPNLQFIVLSNNGVQWCISTIACVFWIEFLLSYIQRIQKTKELVISGIVFTGLIMSIVSMDPALFSIVLLPSLGLALISFILWISVHILFMKSYMEETIQPSDSPIDTSESKIFIVNLITLMGLTSLVTSLSYLVDYGMLIIDWSLVLVSCISGFIVGLFTFLIFQGSKKFGWKEDYLQYIRPLIGGLLTLLLVHIFWDKPWYAPPSLVFYLVLFSSMIVVYGQSLDLSNQLVRFFPKPEEDETDDKTDWMDQIDSVAEMILIRWVIGVIIVIFLVPVLGLIEVIFQQYFVILLILLSYSAYPFLPEFSTSVESSTNPFLIVALSVLILEFCIFYGFCKSKGDSELAVQRYRFFEPFVAIGISLAYWIVLLPFVSVYGFQSSVFSLLLITSLQISIYYKFSLSSDTQDPYFLEWISKESSSVRSLVTLALMFSILLSQYYVHLLHVGLVYGVFITLGIYILSRIAVYVCFTAVNHIIVTIQKTWIRPQGPLLLVDLLRDILGTSIVIIFLQNIMSIPIGLVLPALLVPVSIISVKEHRPDNWSRIVVNGIEFSREFPSRMTPIKRIVKTFGIIAVLIISVWSVSAIYEIAIHPQSEVRVAVIDTGINLEDPQLATHVVAEKSFINTQYNYKYNDSTTVDWYRVHGTHVAKLVLEVFPKASIINAKTGASTGSTAAGIAAAIHWAVEEEGADVINLSLGGLRATEKDAAIEWAWKKGVVVVAAAGNEQENVNYSTIISPADSPYSIAVAALQSKGNLFNLSSWGPPREAIIKPDIAALGNFMGSDWDRGTSFASPRVAGAAADLIHTCLENDLQWTPGLIKASLLKGALPLSLPEYMIGAGRLDLNAARSILMNADVIDGIPYVAHLTPKLLPLDLEKVFTGSEYKFTAQLTCSIPTDFLIEQSISSISLDSQSTLHVNQTALIPLTLNIPQSSSPLNENIQIFMTGRGKVLTLLCGVHAVPPIAKVAIDISHSINMRDSIFMEYFELYHHLVDMNISVTEIRQKADFSNFTSRGYDALIVMNPWLDNSTKMITEEIDEVQSFFESGGGVFFAPAQSGVGQNVTHVNEVIDWSGFSFLSNQSQYYYNLNISQHNVTTNLQDINLKSWLLNVPPNGTVMLSHGPLESGFAIMACHEGVYGRLVIAGTSNYFQTSREMNLSLNIIRWLIGEI